MSVQGSPTEGQSATYIDGTTRLSRVLFGWSFDLIKKNRSETINTEQIPKLPQEYSSAQKCKVFCQKWEELKLQGSQNLLLGTIIKTFKGEIIATIVLAVFNYALYLTYPVLINFDISYIQDGESDLHLGIILFFITIFGQLAESILSVHLKYRQTILGISIASTVNLAIFKKTTKYPNASCHKFTQADIISFSQIDAQNLKQMGSKFIFFTFGIIQVVVGLVMLVIVIDFLFFIAIGLIVIVNIVCFKIGKVMMRNNLQILQTKDKILSGTKEMLMNIRHIKANGLEKSYYKKITGERQLQLGAYKLKGILQSIMTFLYFLTSPCLLSAIFLAEMLISKEITPAKIYVTLTIGRIFQFTAALLPNSIAQSVAIYNSINRIEAFLKTGEVDSSNYLVRPRNHEEEYSIVINQGKFFSTPIFSERQSTIIGQIINNQRDMGENGPTSRTLIQTAINSQPLKPLIKDINLKIEKGKFYMVIGGVGAGKSTLFLSILNELKKSSESSISVNGSIAYVPQKPWMICDSLQNNVYFTFDNDERRLIQALDTVCLLDDISLLPQGGNTSVGQDGINLSIGQKASISLARAIYSQKDIYLLDDVLSQVYPQIGQNILKNVVKDTLKGKTVILATSSVNFAHLADRIVLMKEGQIVAEEDYWTISQLNEFRQLQQSFHPNISFKEEEGSEDPNESSESKVIPKLASKQEIFRSSSASAGNRLVLDQQIQMSSLNYEVILQYIKLNGGYLSFFSGVIGSLLSYSAFQTAGSIFMEQWSDTIGTKSSYLFFYIGFIIGSNIFIFIQSYFLLVSSIRQGKQVHYTIIKQLLYSSYTNFFSRVPAGRVLNRLSKDLKQLDEVVGINLSICLLYLVQLISGIILVVFSTTYFAIIPVVIVFVICFLIRKYYVIALHRITRLEKVTNSPLISGLMTLVSGLTTIRAYNQEDYFIDGQAKRLDQNKKMILNKYGLESWFLLAQTYLIFFLNSFCVGFAMFSHRQTSSNFGLLLISIISINEIINGLIFQFTTFQTNLICLERLYQFMRLPAQTAYDGYLDSWDIAEEIVSQGIKEGLIQFRNVSIRYREDLPDIVTDFSVKIMPGQKIGIIGHTNSGKSSILSSLIRIAEVSSGNILIDNIDINGISIKSLRSQITVVEQQPSLIEGTYRENIDFMNSYSDSELKSILGECNLLRLVEQRGGLLAKVDRSGLSMGEKQLLCICRALLSKNKIILIDDSTATLDASLDSLIQKVIQNKFKGKTVIHVTNRLSTLWKYDNILVLLQGKLIEYGPPNELYNKKGVFFKSLGQVLGQKSFTENQ